MKSKLINDNGLKTYALIFDEDDEVTQGIKNFTLEKNLTGASFSGIGAFKKLTMGYFDIDKKDYIKNEIDEQVEVVSLIGNISRYKNKPKVHIHLAVGKRNGNALGGHLLKGIVRPTLEIILNESPAYLQREFKEEYNLSLINLDKG